MNLQFISLQSTNLQSAKVVPRNTQSVKRQSTKFAPKNRPQYQSTFLNEQLIKSEEIVPPSTENPSKSQYLKWFSSIQ
jgi:hypothetical protein